MSTIDDSSFEMHDDSLDQDTAERLLDGEVTSSEFTDLAAMIDDLRSRTSATPTPSVRGALAEYVGVGLTVNQSSAVLPTAPAVSDPELTVADRPRRRSMFAEALTFAGTVSGKLLLGGAVAAASVTGAQVTGIVELPGMSGDDRTVIVADVPIDAIPAELPLVDRVEKPAPAAEQAAKPDDVDGSDAKDASAKDKDLLPEELEPKAMSDEPVAAPKDADPEKDDPEKDQSSSPNADEAAAALEAQLHLDKEAVYRAASDLIGPLEGQKKELVNALNAILGTLEQARNEAKAPLYAELETTLDPVRRAEIETELGAIFDQWQTDRDAAVAAADPAIAAVRAQLAAIELERDTEISRLIEKFQADLAALQD
jgi:hypothetical protein